MFTAAITTAVVAWLNAQGVEVGAVMLVGIGVSVKLFVVTPIVAPAALWARKKALAAQAAEQKDGKG